MAAAPHPGTERRTAAQLILVTPSHATQLCRYQMFTLTKSDTTGQHDIDI